MIEVQMSKDLRDTPPKIIGPFTQKQLICIAISLGYGLPLFFILGSGVNIALRIIITLVTMAPTIACGYCQMYGMPLEKFMKHLWNTKIAVSPKRKYIVENAYSLFMTEETTKKGKKKK